MYYRVPILTLWKTLYHNIFSIQKTATHDAGGGGRRPRPGATEWGAMRGAGEMGKDRRHLKVMTLASPR